MGFTLDFGGRILTVRANTDAVDEDALDAFRQKGGNQRRTERSVDGRVCVDIGNRLSGQKPQAYEQNETQQDPSG